MKKNVTLLLGMSIGMAIAFSGCGSGPSSKAPDLTGVTTYYVRADGNDKNKGISEDMPFKTLVKALQAASKSSIKKITVIGVLDGIMALDEVKKTAASPVIEVTKYMDATGGQDIAKVLTDNIGVAQLKGSYDAPNPNEILITGKPDASSSEKAVLTSTKGGPVLQVLNMAIRLEHIEISGCQNEDGAIWVVRGNLTLAQDAKITRNSGDTTIYIHRGLVIMRDNAEVSYNEGKDNVGVYLENGSVGIMLDNTVITNNKAANNGGGVALEGSTLIMKNNASISNNSAGNAGGGIITFTDKKNGYISQVTIGDNASVTKNSARIGGGILLQDELILRDTARITENTASVQGGGIWGETDNASVFKEENTILANNKAPNSPDSNFTWE